MGSLAQLNDNCGSDFADDSNLKMNFTQEKVARRKKVYSKKIARRTAQFSVMQAYNHWKVEMIFFLYNFHGWLTGEEDKNESNETRFNRDIKCEVAFSCLSLSVWQTFFCLFSS